MTYPKILELHPDQPHKEKWEKYFRKMYEDEVNRLSTVHEDSVKQGVLELKSTHAP